MHKAARNPISTAAAAAGLIAGMIAAVIIGVAGVTSANAETPAWHGDGSTVCPAGFYPYEGDCYPDELLDHDPNYVPEYGHNGGPATTEPTTEAPATVTVTEKPKPKPTTEAPEPTTPAEPTGTEGGDDSGSTGEAGSADTE